MREKQNKKSRGFGFIVYRDEQAINNLFSNTNWHKIQGKVIECKRAVAKNNFEENNPKVRIELNNEKSISNRSYNITSLKNSFNPNNSFGFNENTFKENNHYLTKKSYYNSNISMKQNLGLADNILENSKWLENFPQNNNNIFDNTYNQLRKNLSKQKYNIKILYIYLFLYYFLLYIIIIKLTKKFNTTPTNPTLTMNF